MREKIEQFVLRSKLSVDQKIRWLEFFNYQDESILSDLFEVMNDENNLEYLTKNLETKIEAANTGNDDIWKKIIKEDEELLNKI